MDRYVKSSNSSNRHPQVFCTYCRNHLPTDYNGTPYPHNVKVAGKYVKCTRPYQLHELDPRLIADNFSHDPAHPAYIGRGSTPHTNPN